LKEGKESTELIRFPSRLREEKDKKGKRWCAAQGGQSNEVGVYGACLMNPEGENPAKGEKRASKVRPRKEREAREGGMRCWDDVAVTFGGGSGGEYIADMGGKYRSRREQKKKRWRGKEKEIKKDLTDKKNWKRSKDPEPGMQGSSAKDERGKSVIFCAGGSKPQLKVTPTGTGGGLKRGPAGRRIHRDDKETGELGVVNRGNSINRRPQRKGTQKN